MKKQLLRGFLADSIATRLRWLRWIRSFDSFTSCVKGNTDDAVRSVRRRLKIAEDRRGGAGGKGTKEKENGFAPIRFR